MWVCVFGLFYEHPREVLRRIDMHTCCVCIITELIAYDKNFSNKIQTTLCRMWILCAAFFLCCVRRLKHEVSFNLSSLKIVELHTFAIVVCCLIPLLSVPAKFFVFAPSLSLFSSLNTSKWNWYFFSTHILLLFRVRYRGLCLIFSYHAHSTIFTRSPFRSQFSMRSERRGKSSEKTLL